MKKSIVSIVIVFTTIISYGQKAQRVAYIDMDYILENIPEYNQAQNTLNGKVAQWQTKIDNSQREIEVMKSDLANEKAILTKDLIEEREEDIVVKQESLRKLESLYFGPNGDLYNLRKQIVKPVQDQVFNAVQNIAKKQRYDFVLDKSSDLVMLYSNKKYDISELILKTINTDRKKQEVKDKESQKKVIAKKVPTEQQKAILDQKDTKKKIQADKRKKILAARDAKRKAILEKRKLLKAKKAAQRKEKEEQRKKEQQNNKQ